MKFSRVFREDHELIILHDGLIPRNHHHLPQTFSVPVIVGYITNKFLEFGEILLCSIEFHMTYHILKLNDCMYHHFNVAPIEYENFCFITSYTVIYLLTFLVPRCSSLLSPLLDFKFVRLIGTFPTQRVMESKLL